MQTLTENVWRARPPFGLFDETLVGNLFPCLSQGARKALVHRAVESGEVMRLKPGLFCLAAEFRNRHPHPFVISGMLRSPSFVSMESALWHHQLIPEATYQVSCVCAGRTRVFKTPLGVFSFFHIPSRPLTAGVRTVEMDKDAWAFVASPLRAIADMVYRNREIRWNDQGMNYLLNNLRIDEEELRDIPLDDYDEIAGSFRSRRVLNFLSGLSGEIKNDR